MMLHMHVCAIAVCPTSCILGCIRKVTGASKLLLMLSFGLHGSSLSLLTRSLKETLGLFNNSLNSSEDVQKGCCSSKN